MSVTVPARPVRTAKSHQSSGSEIVRSQVNAHQKVRMCGEGLCPDDDCGQKRQPASAEKEQRIGIRARGSHPRNLTFIRAGAAFLTLSLESPAPCTRHKWFKQTVRGMQRAAVASRRFALSGIDPALSGIKSALSGIEQELPGIGTALPGIRTVLPGIRTVLPGIRTVLPGIRTVLPGIRTALPGIRTALPGIGTAPPGIRTALPGIRTVLPGIRMAWPGIRTGLPGIRTVIPGSGTALPGIKTALPGIRTVLPGIGTALPGIEPPAFSSNQKIRITDSDHVVFCRNVCPSKPCDQSW
jgi:hypothetical protein